MEIKVLGTGSCGKCAALMKAVQTAVSELGTGSQVEEITDIEKIIEYGVMRTPAMVVDGEIISSGKIMSKEEIKTILKSYIQ